jgi:hypothetical protein
MEFCGNFLSNWDFSGILFGGLLARIAEYLLNESLREVKFHMFHVEMMGDIMNLQQAPKQPNANGICPSGHQGSQRTRGLQQLDAPEAKQCSRGHPHSPFSIVPTT